jgi:hypothetical protein
MSSEEMEGTSPQWGSHPHLGKGTLGTWRTHRQHGGRAQYRPYADAKRWVEAVVKPGESGAYVHQLLSFTASGKVHGRKAKA